MTQPRDQLLYSGFGNALGRAFELAGVPVVCALAGRWLDQRLGVQPLLTVVLITASVVGGGARMYYGYRNDIESSEDTT